MTPSAINVVVFDLGEVLARPIGIHQAIAAQVGIPAENFAAEYWQWREDYDKGLSPLEYWTKVFANSDFSPSEDEANSLSQEDSTAWAQIEHGEIEMLTALKEKGFQLVLLTNSPQLMTEIIPQQDWSALFEYVYVSADIGLAKPDPQIFHRVEKDLGIVDPNNILFFDDRRENVDAACECGWVAVLWTSAHQLREELTTRGLLPHDKVNPLIS